MSRGSRVPAALRLSALRRFRGRPVVVHRQDGTTIEGRLECAAPLGVVIDTGDRLALVLRREVVRIEPLRAVTSREAA